MAQILPEGISASVFKEALGELKEAIGPQWVFADDPERLIAYRDHFAIRDPDLTAPSAAVTPKEVEEIQKVPNGGGKYYQILITSL